MNKKVLALIIGVILIIIPIIYCLTRNNENEEEQIKVKLNEYVIKFYEEFYFPKLSKDDNERGEYLSKYEQEGIKITANGISRIDEKYEKILDDLKMNDITCDMDKTYGMIYPKSPYDIKDYKIELFLECKKKSS